MEMKRCEFGDQCGDREVGIRLTGEHVREPRWIEGGPVCPSDERRTAAALDELPALYISLARLYREPRSASDGRGGTQVYPGLPVRPECDAVMREAHMVLASWAEVVQDANRLTAVQSGTTFAQFRAHCRTLRVHLDAFLRLPATTVARHVDASQVANLPDDTDGTVLANGDAVVYSDLTGAAGALELIALQRRARGMLGETRRVRRIDVVTCPRCDLLSLTRPEGSEYIECSDADCGTLLTRDEFAERVREALKGAQAAMSRLGDAAAQAAGAFAGMAETTEEAA